MDFEVIWLVRIGLGRPTVYQKIRSVDKGGPKLWTRENAKIGKRSRRVFHVRIRGGPTGH